MTSELITTRRADFYDEKGEYHGNVGFSKHKKHFKYGRGSYHVDFKRATCKHEVIIPFLWSRKTYFYNTKNSNPLKLDKEGKPIIDPELYNINLETKVARDLNDLAKTSPFDFLKNPKALIIILIAGVVIYYFATGNKLF